MEAFMSLPQKICVLDLEGRVRSFDRAEDTELWFVGTQQYTLMGSGYRASKHRVWLPNALSALENYLQAFPGVIIGQNIFKFDYRVLGRLINLFGIIEKTVDTLALCWWKRWHVAFDPKPDMPRFLSWEIGPEVKGLSLDKLSRSNFNTGKTFDGRLLRQIWKTDQSAVFRYNANDCALTRRLWLHLVTQKSLKIPDGANGRTFTLSNREVSVARGTEPWITFPEWDHWRVRTYLKGEPGGVDFVPLSRCPRCGDWKNWGRFDELQVGSDMSEGQEADWMAGNWGTANCLNCGLVIDWEDDAIEFRLPHEPSGDMEMSFASHNIMDKGVTL
jgi:hypothetical protein